MNKIKIIGLLMLLLPTIVLSQQQEEIITIQNEVNLIKENLSSHQTQFKAGVITNGLGITSLIIGSLTGSNILIFGGGILSFIGNVIMIDSHKWFGEKRMKGYFIIGERKKRHSLEEIYHSGSTWKINETIDCYWKDRYQEGKIIKIFLHKNNEISFEIKLLKNNETIFISFSDIEKI